MDDAVAAFRGVTKTFGDVGALTDVSFEVRRGEIFGLLGPNGAGKTTLLRILTGLMAPTDGGVEVLGAAVPADYRRVSRRVGAMVGDPSPYPALTALENVRIAALLSGGASRPREWKASLESVGLGTAMRRPARTLSTGMTQRLALAMALVGEPELVVLDEPTSGMDPVGLSETRRLFLSLRDSGTTLIISSHQMYEIEAIADRVGFLSRGAVAAIGRPQDLLAGERMLRLGVVDGQKAAEILRAEAIDVLSCSASEVECRSELEPALRALAGGGVIPTSVTECHPSLTDMFLALPRED